MLPVNLPNPDDEQANMTDKRWDHIRFPSGCQSRHCCQPSHLQYSNLAIWKCSNVALWQFSNVAIWQCSNPDCSCARIFGSLCRQFKLFAKLENNGWIPDHIRALSFHLLSSAHSCWLYTALCITPPLRTSPPTPPSDGVMMLHIIS